VQVSPTGLAPTGGKPLLVSKTTCVSIDRNLSIRYASVNAWASRMAGDDYIVEDLATRSGTARLSRGAPPRSSGGA